MGPPSNIFFQLVFISWMVTLSSCLVWQIGHAIMLCRRLAGKIQGMRELCTESKLLRHPTFFFQVVLISSMVTLSSCQVWQIISFILPPNAYDCVYAWTTLGNIATDRHTDRHWKWKQNCLWKFKKILSYRLTKYFERKKKWVRHITFFFSSCLFREWGNT